MNVLANNLLISLVYEFLYEFRSPLVINAIFHSGQGVGVRNSDGIDSAVIGNETGLTRQGELQELELCIGSPCLRRYLASLFITSRFARLID